MTRPYKQIDAVLFDLDDTLIDWAQPTLTWLEFTNPKLSNIYNFLTTAGYTLPDFELFCEVANEANIEVWTEAKKSWTGAYFTTVLRRTLTAVGVECEEIDFDELLRIYDWKPMPGVVAFEDAIPVLEELRRRDYKIGLITNSIMPMWMRDVELHHYGIMDYLDARVASGDTGYLKPHPAIFEYTLELLHTTPERSVFVGDRPANDIAGANAVGMVSVLMTPPHLNRELNGVTPDYTITRLRELLPILESLEVT